MTTDSSISTVVDYVEAIQRVSSGQFISRLDESGQHYFASTFGAPLFALSTLAPEALASNDSSLLVITSDPAHAADGGRWWSLYARVHKPNKFGLTVCFSHKPPNGRPPKLLLFQPPQQIVRNWQKHLQSLGSPPDVVMLFPKDFDELVAVKNELIARAPGRKLLVAFCSRLEALIARCLLASNGYLVGDLIDFRQSQDEPQHFASGAWWFSTIIPEAGQCVDVDDELVDKLRDGYSRLSQFLHLADSKEEAVDIARSIACRTNDIVEGEAVQALRLSGSSGVDLASGRYFKKVEEAGADRFVWDESVMSADVLALQPSPNSEGSEDEDRLGLLLWFSHAAVLEAERELKKMAGEDAAALPDEIESARLPESPSNAAVESLVAPETAIEATSKDATTEGATIESAEALFSSSKSAPVEAGDANAGASICGRNRPKLSRSAGTVNVLALAAMLGKGGEDSGILFEAAKGQILAWLGSSGVTLKKSAENIHIESRTGEVTVETDGHSIWTMRFDNRSTMETGAIWRVEATLIGHPVPAISLRLIQVRSSEDAPPPVISGVPRLIVAISESVGLQDAGEQLRNAAVHLKNEGDSTWLGRLLLNPHRTQPVIVISGKVDASADRLARRLVGVAHVVCIDHATSSRMVRVFGRERSVFGNAVRLYRPGFSADANPFQHPIWALKGVQLPRWLADNIFEEACAISLEAGDLDERAPSFQSIRNLLAAKRMASSERRISELRQQTEKAVSSKDEKIRQLQKVRDEQHSILAMYREENAKLIQQIEQLKGELQAKRLECSAAAEEIRQLNYRVNNQWADEALGDPTQNEETYYPDNWDELEEWVDSYGDGKLVIHEKALKAVKTSPFKDIRLAYKALEYLVRYFVPMKQRDPEDDAPFHAESAALAELGMEREPVGEALNNHRYKQSYRRLYEGKTIWLEDHLKWGVGFDPASVFRLYFHYHEASGKVIVGHLTTHLPNSLTHTS